MPVETCNYKKAPGFRWGKHGKCYTYASNDKKSRKSAYAKAALQGRAIKRSQSMGGNMKSGTINKIFGAAVAVTPGGGGGAIQWPGESLRELNEQGALLELNDYIASLGMPATWASYVWDSVQDRFYAAYSRQQRWDDAYLDAKTAVDEYYKQYLAYEAQQRAKLDQGVSAEPPAWMEEKDMKESAVKGGTMLSLRGLLMASASLGDLLALLRKVQDPVDEVKKAIKQLEGMIAKYDEGASAKDLSEGTLKQISALLKKVPKPTEEHPRTRVLQALKLLKEMTESKLNAGILSASIVQVAKILEAVENPTDAIKQAVKLAKQLAESYEKGAPQGYGNIVSVEGMTKLLKLLEAVDKKPESITKAIKALKKLMGTEDKGALPGYGVSKLQTSERPGVYYSRLIHAGEALDGTIWDKEQLKSAVERKLFEGVPVNAISYTGSYGPDIEYHLPEDSALVGQVVGNQVGFVKDATWNDTDDSAYGYVYITDPSRRNLVDAMLKEGLDAPGMSIYADGTKENNLVTGISSVYSMDLVTFPAADGAILSQALTAAVKSWGARRTRLMGADPGLTEPTAAPATETPAPSETPQVPETVDVAAAWKEAYAAWRRIDWAGQLGTATGAPSDAIMGLMDKMKTSIDEFSQLALAGAPKEEYEKLVARYGGKKEAPAGVSAMNAPQSAGFKARPTKRAAKVGGGMMNDTALDKRLAQVEAIAYKLNSRVSQADIDEMIDTKLKASKLPEGYVVALRNQMLGKQLSAEEVDGFIGFQQGIADQTAGILAKEAGVTLEGALLPENDDDTIDGALKALFDSQE